MQRRKFLILLTLTGTSLLSSQFFLKKKTKDFLKSVLYFLKSTVDLPHGGETTSVEKALNSRCTSDYDGNPHKYHWGMFDKAKKLSGDQIEKVIALAKIPQFTDRKVEIQSERNMLTFIVQKHVSGIVRDWMMVESGMQQQAVGLVCAALGVGMIFKNLGKDGSPISDADHATIKIKLDPMKPTYNSSFWSNSPPAIRNPWLRGNLPDPARDGDKPLISTLASLKIENKSSTKSAIESVSQLLWAARGKTPHLYNSKPWGMTIPTWAGEQHISSVYLISDNELSKYVNWDSDRVTPTHTLSALHKIDAQLLHKIERSFSPNRRFIVLGKNEDFARAFWEVGYQLLNLLLQAGAMDIGYQAALLDEAQRKVLSDIGVHDPVAILAI